MSENSEQTATPSAVLKEEHQTIKRVLAILQILVRRARDEDAWESEPLGRCVEFFKLFADACHHAKEEDLLFPVMEERGIPREGGPIGVMLFEHRMAREFTAQMAAALNGLEEGDSSAREQFLTAADEYIGLLTHHIYKEDFVLFPMGDGCLTPEDQNLLHKKFCDVNCGMYGGKRREELERIADELEGRWSGEA